MGCGGSPRFSNELVQIQGMPITAKQSTEPRQTRRSRGRPAKAPRVDYHCEICGHTGPHKEHSCPGLRPVSYHYDRLAKCNYCKYNEERLCTLYKSQHPDRDCNIDVGIAMPEARCPAGLWDRVLLKCDNCKSVSFNENGIGHCPKCGNTPPRNIAMPFKITNTTEPPLEATRDLAIITIAAGQEALELLELTGPPMRAYAEKCGADFHVITNNLHPEYPIANKFRLKHLVANYKRVLFLDVDIWIRPSAENLFEQVPEGTIGIHLDMPYLRGTKWVEGEAALTASQQKVDPVKLMVLNTGVVLFDTDHADIWTHPPLPAPHRHLTEQTWVEYNIQRKGYPLTLLDIQYNTQYWMPRFKSLEPAAKFVHLANAEHSHRIYQFRKYQWSERNAAVV
jgi:hypothetical protein